MRPHPLAALYAPRAALGGCLMACVERDTRGCDLSDLERFNYYPATPLASISWIFEGTLHLADNRAQSTAESAEVELGGALPRMTISGPQRGPTVSWSPGPVHAMTVGFYPEAMARLLGHPIAPLLDKTLPLEEVAPADMFARCEAVLCEAVNPFFRLQNELEAMWSAPSLARPVLHLSHWVRGLTTQLAHSGSGRSLRQWQRRFREWTGQSQRDLQKFIRLEEAFIRRHAQGVTRMPSFADVAADAGFADQSHMGREVRRVTGESPGRFGERLVHDQAFWYYRLIAGMYEATHSLPQ
jgi:AraC-like DNA-binding protein